MFQFLIVLGNSAELLSFVRQVTSLCCVLFWLWVANEFWASNNGLAIFFFLNMAGWAIFHYCSRDSQFRLKSAEHVADIVMLVQHKA